MILTFLQIFVILQRLAIFAERLRRGKRAMTIFTKRISRLSAGIATDISATPSAASVLREIQANKGKLQLQLQLSNLRHQDPTSFLLDDVVDGLWILANGTQRWYPGRINAVNANGTYAVKYLDGDVHEEKILAEIRHSKNSKLSTARSVRNLHGSGQDNYTSRDRSETSARPSGTLSIASNFCMNDIPSSRNSSMDSGSAPSPYFSFYNPPYDGTDATSHSSTAANDSRLSLFPRKPSFRSSVSSTPRLSGLLEDRGGRGTNEGIKIVSQAQRALVGPVLLSSDAGQNISRQQMADRSNNLSEDFLAIRNQNHHPVLCRPIRGLEAAAEKLLQTTDKDRIIQPDCQTPTESPRPAPFLGEIRKPLSWESNGSGSSGDSDGQTFAIPSVFPTPRSERKVDGKR